MNCEFFQHFEVRTYNNSPTRYYIKTNKRTFRINKNQGEEFIKGQIDIAGSKRKMNDIVKKILRR